VLASSAVVDRGEAFAGKYESLRRLAVGGMGEIYLARERGQLSRLVVIKRLLPQVARDKSYVEMFVDEARIIGHLNHPNICQILELGWDGGLPFIALEYVRGMSVAEIWDHAQTAHLEIPRAVTLRILTDTAWALHFAHEARDVEGRPLRLVHRDISPQNVMVTFVGDVKLMDFGIARAENRVHRTQTGQVKGKIAYMAPEQLRAQPLDRRADVFAVGVMLWEMTLNRRLFDGSSDVEILYKAGECKVPLPSSIDPAYPPALETIVMRALAADREQRTATAGELAAALAQQVTATGGAERTAIATIMTSLFPAESSSGDDTAADHPAVGLAATAPSPAAPPRSTMPLVEAAPAVASSEVRPTVPLRAEPSELRPTVPLRAESSEVRPTVPWRAESAVSQTPPRSRAPSAWVIASLVLAAAAIAAIVITQTTDAPHETVAAAAPPTPPPPVASVAAPIAPALIAPDAATEPDAAPPAPAQVSRAAAPHHNPAPAHLAPTSRASELGQASPTSVAPATNIPAAPPAQGVLAIASTPIGVVIVDGIRRDSTPLQISLPSGDHDIAIELEEGAGTLRARARIEPGKKTKCKGQDHALACASQP
jgi:serine/threonine protein kinase